jgi:hypothetical protein
MALTGTETWTQKLLKIKPSAQYKKRLNVNRTPCQVLSQLKILTDRDTDTDTDAETDRDTDIDPDRDRDTDMDIAIAGTLTGIRIGT